MIDNLVLALDGAWKVLLVGTVLGAGLPVLFALGVRALAYSGEAGEAGSERTRQGAKALSVFLFLLVVLGVLAGVGAIVASGFDVELGSLFG